MRSIRELAPALWASAAWVLLACAAASAAMWAVSFRYSVALEAANVGPLCIYAAADSGGVTIIADLEVGSPGFDVRWHPPRAASGEALHRLLRFRAEPGANAAALRMTLPLVAWLPLVVAFPAWCVPVALLATRVLAVRRRRRADAVAGGACRECGYDLRATPGRCPECGTAALTRAAPA